MDDSPATMDSTAFTSACGGSSTGAPLGCHTENSSAQPSVSYNGREQMGQPVPVCHTLAMLSDGSTNLGLPSMTLRHRPEAELFVCDNAACLNMQNRHVVRPEEWDKCDGLARCNRLFVATYLWRQCRASDVAQCQSPLRAGPAWPTRKAAKGSHAASSRRQPLHCPAPAAPGPGCGGGGCSCQQGPAPPGRSLRRWGRVGKRSGWCLAVAGTPASPTHQSTASPLPADSAKLVSAI